MTDRTRRTLFQAVPAWLALCAGVGMPARHCGAQAADLAARQQADRLVITDRGLPVAEYVFRDETILRPYLASVHAPGGIQVTRHHPPVPGTDPTDHDTMHPGVWLALGDLSGQDFWRNKGKIKHVRFSEPPAVREGRLSFVAENVLEAEDGRRLGKQISRLTFAARPAGYLLTWEATFRSDQGDLVFGDQEEMGLGVRVATAITEKNGGTIRSSEGLKGAAATWGRTADWADCCGTLGGSRVGILLMPDPGNFRRSWFHNRDYGLMAANPFGRKAFTGGEKSEVVVRQREALRLRFGLLIHSSAADEPLDLEAEYAHFLQTLKP